VNQTKLQQIFDRYKDSDTGNIEYEGLMRFFTDLGVDPETDSITMYISYKMGAANIGTYTFTEFFNGFKAIGVSTMDELKKKLSTLNNDVKGPEEFKKMYKFVYNFARDKSKKNMGTEMAIDLWNTLLKNKCRFLNDWIEFIQTDLKDQIVIPLDSWNMFLELIETTMGDMNKFVDDGSWPPMIDQFVAYYGKKYAAK
jgi:DCN1-like protein 1/2